MIQSAISRSACAVREKRDEPQRAAAEMLLQFGITPHLGGFDPLCSEIRMMAERNRSEGVPPFFGARPTIAALWQDADTEHAIRDALSAGFMGPDGIHMQTFPFADRPSSAEFVCTIAELLRDRISQFGT